mgnify:CR=1 FL=1
MQNAGTDAYAYAVLCMRCCEHDAHQTLAAFERLVARSTTLRVSQAYLGAQEPTCVGVITYMGGQNEKY